MAHSSRLRRHIRSNAVGYVALFMALTIAPAWAASITASDIKKNAVRSKHIKAGNVRAPDLDADAVTSPAIGDGEVTGADLDETTLGQVPNAQTATNATNAGNADALDGLNSSEFVQTESAAGGDLGGSFSNLQIGAGAVGSAEVGSDALGGADINESSLAGFNPDQVGPRLYASVEAAGNVAEADSKGLSDAAVFRNDTGAPRYCFETGFDVHAVTATADLENDVATGTDRIVHAFNEPGASCAPSDDAVAYVYDISLDTAIAADFYVMME